MLIGSNNHESLLYFHERKFFVSDVMKTVFTFGYQVT